MTKMVRPRVVELRGYATVFCTDGGRARMEKFCRVKASKLVMKKRSIQLLVWSDEIKRPRKDYP